MHTQDQVYEATQRARADKAYYRKLVRRELNIDGALINALYFTGKLPPAFPMPVIPLKARWFSKEETKYRTLCVVCRYHDLYTYVAWWDNYHHAVTVDFERT